MFYAVDEVADIVDIVSEENTGKERDDDDEKCLCGIIGMKVTETDCQDDGSTEIIAPDVLLKPLQLVNVCWGHPIIIVIEESDSDESADFKPRLFVFSRSTSVSLWFISMPKSRSSGCG